MRTARDVEEYGCNAALGNQNKMIGFGVVFELVTFTFYTPE